MKNHFDVIVLGLGAMGSASVYQLSNRGKNVLGIDQFSPPHVHGSTHGDTRITRQAIGEGEQYTPMSLRSYEIFTELEKATGRNLLTITGGLIISSETKTSDNHVPDFFNKTVLAAKKYGIEHSILTAEEIRKRFPQFNVKDDEFGYYEDNAGFLRPEECIRANLELAHRLGAQLNINEKVISYEAKDNLVIVKTDKGEYAAEQLVISAGPWLPQLLEEEYRKFFTVRRQVLYWFDVEKDIESFLPENFPIFIWELQGAKQGIYGFPAIDGAKGGIKIATEQLISTTEPDNVDRVVSEEEIKNMYKDSIAPYFPSISDHCVKSLTCLYTITSDFGFIIDRHPKHPNILLVSPCSGHGFKHSAAIGEIVSELIVDGKAKLDISSFSLKRFIS